MLDDFRHFYGPTMNAFEAAKATGREDALADDLGRRFAAQNSSVDPDVTTVEATFLRVTVIKPS